MIKLQPFFSYYGGKYRAAPHYPEPKLKTIIEPFAGSAGYSVRYPHKKVILYDKNEKICGVWDFLIKSTNKDIRNIPSVVAHVDDIKASQEIKWLVGFWLNKGASSPCKQPSSWMKQGLKINSFWGKAIKQRILRQHTYIKHWKIYNKSFENIRDRKATWFIDPPYQVAGKHYRHGSKYINYSDLADFCKSRTGRVIVCENEGAKWLTFKPFRDIKSSAGNKRSQISKEVIWSKYNALER